MTDCNRIAQQVHELLNEAHEMLLAMTLPGVIDAGRIPNLIARINGCAEEAREAGKANSARHLREAASMLEQESSKTAP